MYSVSSPLSVRRGCGLNLDSYYYVCTNVPMHVYLCMYAKFHTHKFLVFIVLYSK